MKKYLALLLALAMLFALAACGEAATPAATEESAAPEEPAATEEPVVEEPAVEEPVVLSYADYAAAEVDTEVTVDCYVQATQSWWDNKITVYAADEDGAYFLYNMACSEEDSAKLVPGQKIRVTGFKSEWAGEVEIVDASFEFVDGESFIAEAKDITEVWGTVDMIGYMNQLVAFKGLTVEAYDESGAAFAYKDAEKKTDDLYFKVTLGDTTYEFCVEYYLCNEETEVYKAVEGLNVGDVIDLEGFLYWYEGPNLQATALTVVKAAPVVLSYADYAAAEVDTEVTVDCCVQATQSWWDNKITVYAADEDGAYFLYNMACSEEDSAKLVPGQKIRVTGFKSEWAGEVEIVDASFEFVDGEPFIAEAKDITEVWGTVDMIGYMNQLVAFKGLTVEPYDESGAGFAYKDAEKKADDLYFKVTLGDTTYEFCVEYYLCNEETEVFKAVEALNAGDVIDLEGFLYWYEGPNLQATALTVVEAAPVEEAVPAMEEAEAPAEEAAEVAAEAPAEEVAEEPAEEVAEAPAEEAAEEPEEEKGEGVMTYVEYAEAEVDTEVVIEGYIQAAQAYSEQYGNTSLYLADRTGAYFVYRLACTQEEYDSLVPGTKLRVTGFKSEWAGEVEITDASYEILESDPYIAEAVDVTALFGTDELITCMNRFFSVEGAVVAESADGAAFLYNWDGSGEDGSDLYFNVTIGENTYNFTVESDLCPAGSEVYEAVKALNVGDTIDLEGFLYWYEGPNPHITAVVVK